VNLIVQWRLHSLAVVAAILYIAKRRKQQSAPQEQVAEQDLGGKVHRS